MLVSAVSSAASNALKHPWLQKADTDEDRMDLSSRSRLRQQASSMDSKVRDSRVAA